MKRTYGITQAFISILRLFWGNFVNMFALFRALSQYRGALKKDEKVAWDKTDHEFPDEVEEVRLV